MPGSKIRFRKCRNPMVLFFLTLWTFILIADKARSAPDAPSKPVAPAPAPAAEPAPAADPVFVHPIAMPVWDLISWAPMSPELRTHLYFSYQPDILDFDNDLWPWGFVDIDGELHTFSFGGGYKFLKHFEVGARWPILVASVVETAGFDDDDASMGNLEIYGKLSYPRQVKPLDRFILAGGLRITLPTSTEREYHDRGWQFELPNDRYLAFEPHFMLGIVKKGFSAMVDLGLSFIAIFPDDDDSDDEFRAVFIAHYVFSYNFSLLKDSHRIAPQIIITQIHQLNQRGDDDLWASSRPTRGSTSRFYSSAPGTATNPAASANSPSVSPYPTTPTTPGRRACF